jgi:hypothetical protein
VKYRVIQQGKQKADSGDNACGNQVVRRHGVANLLSFGGLPMQAS